MPNYDGTGPLRRGRVIGRGTGPCKKADDTVCQRKDAPEDTKEKTGTG
jgi:hypothetical protein